MTTIEDAWRWYQAVLAGLVMTNRIVARYWSDLPWEGRLGQDDRFRNADPDAVQLDTTFGLDHLDDLAVLVLFSVFEATVRERVLEEVRRQTHSLNHALLIHAVDELRRGIEEGSFFRILEPFKAEISPDLVELVNQVRRYRNWVAHGRRGHPPVRITPEAAFERLRQFLAVLQPPA